MALGCFPWIVLLGYHLSDFRPSTLSLAQFQPLGLLAGYQANLVFFFNPLWPPLECSLSLQMLDGIPAHLAQVFAQISLLEMTFPVTPVTFTSPTQHYTYLYIAFLLNYLRN